MHRRIGLGLVVALLLLAGLLLWRSRRPADAIVIEERAAATSAPGRLSTRPGFGLAAGAALTAPRARLSGRVTDPAGKPIAGALVCADGAGEDLSQAEMRESTCARSGPDGRYQLGNLYPAFWVVNASAAGHRPGRFREQKEERLQLGPGQERSGVDLVLRPGGVELRGRVKDLGGGVVPGALVTVAPSGMGWGQPPAVTRADDKGEWRVFVAPGRVEATAQAPGYAPNENSGMAPGSFVEILLTPESVLVGRVVAAGTQQPVAGALVHSSDGMSPAQGAGSALSDGDGRFRIERLAPGRYKPTAVTIEQWGQARESVVLGLGQRSAEVLIEVHGARALAGRVLIAGSDQPCPDGWVTLNDRTGQRRRNGRIHGDGRLQVRGLLPGSYQVSVNCFDYLSEDRYPPVVVADRPLPETTWRVRPALHISGTVVAADGTAVGAGALAATLSGGDPRGQRADGWEQLRPDGTFEVTGLMPGSYSLQVMASGQPELKEPVKVALSAGRSVDGLRIVLDRAGAVKGTVADEDGRPVPGAEVQASGEIWSWNEGVMTLEDGTFLIDGLRPGSYRVAARRLAWGDQLRAPGGKDDDLHGVKVAVKAGAVVPVKLTVERQSGKITGTVTQNGKPVSDAFVDAQRESESAAAAEGDTRRSMEWEWFRQPVLTDADGRFTVTRLSAGKYLVRAYRKGGGEATAEHVAVDTSVALVIKATGAISGTLGVVGRSPPESFRISATDDDTGISVGEAFWRTGGQWALRELPAGNFKVRVEAREGSAEESVALAEGQTRSGIRLEVKPRATVRGQAVTLDTGKPLPGMRVVAQQPGVAGAIVFDGEGDGERTHISDADGRFELKDTPPGRMMIYMMPRDWEDSEYGFCLCRATVQAGQDLNLPPVRCPRRRVKARETGGDLGFTLKQINPAAAFEPVPMLVAVVRPGGPAAQAGLRVGDVVISVDGQDVTGPNDYLFWTSSEVPEGTPLRLGLARGGTLSVTAGPRP